VEDEDATGYYMMINIPYVIYVIAFLYVYFTYGTKIMYAKEEEIILEQELDNFGNNDSEI
jgi:hypothetical protein